jgi:endonuclease YncB( thermonuclease family)
MMRRTPCFAPFTASIGLLLALSAPPAAAAADCPSVGTEPLAAVAATDGATLKLNDGSEVRLAGIEAPSRPLGLPANAPWPIADQARDRLAAIAAGGALTVAWVLPDPDRYGRRHGYVFAAGAPIAPTLLGEGLARAREYPGEGACFAAFLDAEAPALAGEKGLWALSQFRPRAAADPSLAEENGLYEVIDGQIDSVGHGTISPSWCRKK